MPKLTEFENRLLDFAEQGKSLDLVVPEFGWRPVTFIMKIRELVARPDVQQERPITVRLVTARFEKANLLRAARTFRHAS